MNVQHLIDTNALFVVNHSGGKDSQAMMIKLLELVPAKQMIVVHASLGDAEWHGALELAQKQAQDAGVPFLVARAVDKDGHEKSFLSMVEKRFQARPEVPSWPSAEQRQCTSDLKRDPIARVVRHYVAKSGHTTIVQCVGVRGAESSARSKLPVWKLNERESKAGRTVHVWHPIFNLSTRQVFATIAAAGQQPHWAYGSGNERLSCVFCVMGSANDIAHGAEQRPELFAQYVAMEERTGYTMHMSRKSLRAIVDEANAVPVSARTLVARGGAVDYQARCMIAA